MKSSPVTIFFCLSVLLSGCRRDPQSLHWKGVEALNQGDYAKATRLLEKAAKKSEGKSASILWGRAGLAAAKAGKRGDAETYFKQALELDSSNGTAHYNLADLLIQQNRLEEAASSLEAANLTLDGTEALESLATISLRQGRFDEAYDFLQQARSREENVRVLTTLAVAGKGQLSVEESRKLLQKAVTLDPNYAPAQLNLAALLDQHRLDPAQAMSHYEGFLRIQPEDDKVPLVRQRMDIMHQRQESGDFSRPDPLRKEVEVLLDQAASYAADGKGPQALRACLDANRIATRADRTDLRERALRAAATLAPDSARAQFGLGQFLASQNRKTEALVLMEKARDLAPGFPLTLRPSVLLATELGQKETANRMLQAGEEAGAANPDMLLDVGDLYAEALNNDRESKRVYRELVENFPAYPNLAEVQVRLNR